jgi:hypothetical protein
MATDPKIKTCPSCGATFPCNPGDCWCNNVRLTVDALLEIHDRYVGCLCESCLRKFCTTAIDSTATG